MPERPRALLFDWDNTLVDTWPTIHAAMNATLAAMGHPLWSLEETRTRVRRSMREAFPEMFGDRWEEARDVFYARFMEVHLSELQPAPGAERLLETIAAQGLPAAVISNKAGEHLRREADHLGWDRYFVRLIGATDTPADKPHPSIVAAALEGTGIAPGSDVWFVGDTWIDMQCAKESGCFAVLVGEPASDRAEIDRFLPDLRFADCHSLSLALIGQSPI